MNQQPITKLVFHERGLLETHHMFATIQGEGPFAGTPAVFIRLYGCNLRCPQCDTDYTSYQFQAMPQFFLDELAQMSSPSKLVVISGGEPFRQNLTPLSKLLVDNGYTVQVETNGTLLPSPGFEELVADGKAFVVCSPKAGRLNKELAPLLCALKYVVHADSLDPKDGLPIKALDHPAFPVVARPPEDFSGVVYVQPIDVQDPQENSRHLEAAIRSCLKFGYTLCLQTHKIINVE